MPTMLVFVMVAALTSQAPAPALTREQMAHFLLTARVVKTHSVSKGVTAPLRLTLTDGVLTHDAAFTSVEEQLPIMRFADGHSELNFVDSYRYTLAAYAIAGLVGLDTMMPVTVPRAYDRHPGAFAWWLDVKMDEGDRLKRKIPPPDADSWARQMHRMHVFTALVNDTDRNAGNILIDADWKIWMIDFTRAFRRSHELLPHLDLTRIDAHLLGHLRTLTAADVTRATAPYLPPAEVEAVMARRDALVALFDGLVAKQGRLRVLY